MLVGAGEIFLRKILQVDTFSKKGDSTEPKTLVIIMFGHTIHSPPPPGYMGKFDSKKEFFYNLFLMCAIA